jgi:hypothetical protein
MLRNKFVLLPANGFIWNRDEFIRFLIANRGQSIVVDTHTEGVCLQSAGVYQLLENFGFTEVLVNTNNSLEQNSRYVINIANPWKFFKVNNKNYQQYHHWNTSKIFGCLYNRPLWHRIGIAAEMQSKHIDVSLINFRSDPHDPDQQQLFEIQQLFEYAPQSLAQFCQVRHTWPRRIESVDSYTIGNTTNAHTDQMAPFYPEFLIDIVAETWIQGRCFFPTEKTVRSMLLKKPMIVMGSQDSLVYLRQMGFKTFHEFWDEDYDGFSQENRYQKILDLIDWIANQSIDTLVDMYQRMQPILDHNHDLLMSQSYGKIITKIL